MPIRFDKDAILPGISGDDARRLLDKVAWLWAHRREVRHQPLKANLVGFYKRRLGAFRIIYTYDVNPDDMVIRLVGKRDDIYRQASK